MLKKGAMVGATVAWTVPLISVVSMTPAHAESPSSGTNSNNSGKGSNPGTPTSPSSAPPLASTGSDMTATAAIGVAAAVLGAGAVAASKYRANRTEGDPAAE